MKEKILQGLNFLNVSKGKIIKKKIKINQIPYSWSNTLKWLQLSASYLMPILPFHPTYLTVLRVRLQRYTQMKGSVAAFQNTGPPNNVNDSPLRMLHRALPLNGS